VGTHELEIMLGGRAGGGVELESFDVVEGEEEEQLLVEVAGKRSEVAVDREGWLLG